MILAGDRAEEAIGLCRELGAQLTKQKRFLARDLYFTLDAWEQMFCLDDDDWTVEAFYLVLRSGPSFADHAQGDAEDANRLLGRIRRDGYLRSQLGEIVELAERLEAFDAEGLRVLRDD